MKTKLNNSNSLGNVSGKISLPEVRMNLSSVSYSRMFFLIVAVAMMILSPSAMKAVTTTMNFSEAASSKQYYETRFSLTQGDNYSAISGAKVGGTVTYRNQGGSGDLSFDISRIAFAYNSNAGIFDQEGSGFYMYAERVGNPWYRGLYTGQWNTELAVLNLKPGDKVTFTYSGSTRSGDNANLRNVRAIDQNGSGGWLTQVGKGQTTSHTIDITFIGDLVVRANQGTIINSITVESNVAEYDITTSGNTTSFVFTKGGSLEVNDFSIPYMSVSFGNKNDFLVVGNDLQSRMFKSDGTETLQTDASINYQPVAGNFYAFRPTGGGTVTVKGGIQGNCTHLFVYNNNTGGWEGKNGNFYAATYNTDDDHYIEFSFDVEKDKTYYICINNQDNNEHGNAFHLHEFSFAYTFHLNEFAKVVDLSTVTGDVIALTHIDGAQGLGSNPVKVKRCTGNINPASVIGSIDAYGWLNITRPTFVEGTDEAGTVILDIDTQGGEATFVVTFPYHANFGYDEATGRSRGHIWNFIDPRNSDSNIGNCWIYDGYSSYNKGTTEGILSLGQYKTPGSQMRTETDNREWTFSQRQTGSAGGGHDPYYMNVFDMEGDNADMIWETEGLWFDTGTNLSCIYNENNAVDDPFKTNPLNFTSPGATDPDRYVGLLPVTDDKKSSFTIPGLKDGDRVLIFMRSGEGSGANGIFLNITGAKDALGNPIDPNDLYKAGGTNWQHDRYEGCYHFIKDGNGNMTFDMQAGSMCKLLYIHIYTGQRIVTTNIVSQAPGDGGKLLFINDKGAELGTNGSSSNMSLRFRNKGQQQKTRVLTCSGNLNYSTLELKKNENTDSHFTVGGTYSQSVDFTSQVGEIGMFRLRMNDVEYSEKYVADFCDRNFTVGYRDKVDSYPYTWDFTDIKDSRFTSAEKLTYEADNYPIEAANSDAYGHEWDISLFDENGNMKVNTGWDPITNNLIFSPHKIGFGNQLWAGDDVIPETRGLWFYSEDDSESNYTSEYSSSLYNDCLQITADGIRFANVPDDAGKRVAWWNYKMVVPDVPQNAAVYLRMKRDTSVPDNAKTWSSIDNDDVPFVATRFQFASQSSKTEVFTTTEVKGDGNYAFYKVSGTDDEWILAVKNTTGAINHLTFTLNGWIVKKLSVSTDSKKVNVKGWTTESRSKIIDPALTAFMTGRDMRTYIVEDVEYSKTKKQATLTRIDTDPSDDPKFKDGCLMPVASDGDNNACIILNCTSDGENGIAGEEAKLLDGGFHLFVPDMHDFNITENTEGVKKYWASCGIESLMKSQVSSTNGDKTITGTTDDGYTNYAFTCKYYDIDPATGDIINDPKVLKEGIQAFYRIVGAASSTGNQGYLPIKIEEETNSGNNENNEGGETNPSRAASPARVSSPERFTIVFNNLSDVSLKDGDVNGDGLFNKLDVNTMADRLAGRPTAKFFTGVADMNGDGRVDIVDMTLMIKNITSE